MSETILIAGATGLFGAHLVDKFAAEGYDVVCSGRDEDKLSKFCIAHGGRPLAFEIQNVEAAKKAIKQVQPFCVVDCAGPFQNYPDYAFAKAVLNSGAHYLDIADDAEFVSGISTLNELAIEKGVTALSGASSTPALAAAVTDTLTADLDHVESIDCAIVPGNKTRRGLSVIRAIMSHIGQKIPMQRCGKIQTQYGWSDTRKIDLDVKGKGPIRKRPASLVDTPDRLIFPDRYQANTVSFRAGLELKLFHYTLWILAYPVRWGWVSNLTPLSKMLYHLAKPFEHFGSDQGGMKVDVLGKIGDTWTRRQWNLIAADGHGPKIPVQPAALAIKRLKDGKIAPGARPCVGELALEELEIEFDKFDSQTQRYTSQVKPIFEQSLGEKFKELPASVKALRGKLGQSIYRGEVRNDGPTGITGYVAALIGGFPLKPSQSQSMVTITANENREHWLRDFGGKTFSSTLVANPNGEVTETFAPFSFHIKLAVDHGNLVYPVASGKLFSILPIPKFFLPQSTSIEYQDEDGNFCFDVKLMLPTGARIGHYRGHLILKETDI